MTRWTRELRLRFVGDQALCKQHIPRARVELGRLLSVMGEGVTTAAMSRELAPGVVVRVAFHAGEPIATIDASGATDVPPPIRLPGIMSSPVSAAYPEGVDPDHPETVLVPILQDEADAWMVTWFDPGVAVWADTPRPRAAYAPAYPEGVHHVGEIDWRGTRGERLSWYGPRSRYWFDPAEAAVNLFPIPYLFHLGTIWLFTSQYAANVDDPNVDGGILGAAIYRRPSDGAVFLHTAQLIDDTVRIIRYTLTEDIAGGGNVRALISTYEILWTQEIPDCRTPWFFNASGTAAVHMTDPFNGAYDWSGVDPPPAACTVWRVAIAPDGAVSSSAESVGYEATAQGGTNHPTPAVVALDFRGDVEVSARVVYMAKDAFNNADTRIAFNVPPEWLGNVVGEFTTGHAGLMEIDGRVFSLQYSSRLFPHYTWDKVLFMDLRIGLVVSLQSRIFGLIEIAPESRRTEVCIWRDGVKVAGFGGADELVVSAGQAYSQWEPGGIDTPPGGTLSPRLLASGLYYLPLYDTFGVSLVPRGFLATCSYGDVFWSIAFADQYARFDANGRFWSQAVAEQSGRVVMSGMSIFGRDDGEDGTAGICNFATEMVLGERTGVGDAPSSLFPELGTSTFYPAAALGNPIF